MPRPSLRALSGSIASGRDQHLDLQVKLVEQDARGIVLPGAPTLLQVGGQWDRISKKYVADAKTSAVLGLHRGQLEAARWLARWFQARASGTTLREGDRAIYSLLLHGGRRAGKTDLGAKAGVCYAVFRPRSWVWLISENAPKTEELEENVRGWLPTSWYEYRGAPWYQFLLANGSVIWLRSAHKPVSLKRGRCDFAVLNEAQNMAESAFAIVRAATADNGGLTVLAANPPDSPVGFWVESFFEEARAGKRPAREFELNARQNPHVDLESLLSMRDEVDERTYRREILGEFLPREDVVFYAWSNAASGNVRPVPQLPSADVTRSFAKKHLYREFDRIVGVDLQKTPYPCAVTLKAFVDPDDPGGEPLLWYVDVTVIENGDEGALSQALIDKGYDPRETPLIIDASGSWQGIDRKRQTPSFEIFESLGWAWVFKPDEQMERNPDIVERIRVANSLMKTASGKRRLFSSPDLLQLNTALKNWENRSGVPYRRSIYAHLGDAATYPLWRFYPRHDLVGSSPDDAKKVVTIPRPRLGPRLL